MTTRIIRTPGVEQTSKSCPRKRSTPCRRFAVERRICEQIDGRRPAEV